MHCILNYYTPGEKSENMITYQNFNFLKTFINFENYIPDICNLIKILENVLKEKNVLNCFFYHS